MTKTKKLCSRIMSVLAPLCIAFGVAAFWGKETKTVNAAGSVGVNTPISWTAEAFGETNNVAISSNVKDADAYEGVAAYKATISSSTQTTGVKITFASAIDLSDYAHVFVRWKNYNSTDATLSTLRVGIDGEPQETTQGYPFYEAGNNGTLGAFYYDRYFSYDIKDMIESDSTSVNSLYIGRTGGSITSGAIDLYIDHIDFVENALKLENVISITNAGQNGTYNVSGADTYSNAAVLETNKTSEAVAAWQGWDMDIYTGEYAFVGDLGVGSAGNFDTRALTLNFDNLDLRNYASIKIKMKNYNSDSTYSTNCTAFLKLNGSFWTSEQSQNAGGGIPKTDWNLNKVANTGHTEQQMRSTYFEYDLLTMTHAPQTLSSLTICRGNAVNGQENGIVIYIDSIEFVPMMAQKVDTLKLGREYKLQDIFALEESLSDKAGSIQVEGYLNSATQSGELVKLGSFATSTLSISGTGYNTTDGTYSVCLTLSGVSSADGETGYFIFVFKVDEGLAVSYKNKPLIVGVNLDLRMLFDVEGLVTGNEFTVNGTTLSGTTYTASEKGAYTIKYKVSNGNKSEETTASVNATEFALKSTITGDFEEGQLEIFADPALPFEGVSYTTALYKATDDIATATPITTANSYAFAESGDYKLVYTIAFASTGQSFTFTTNYDVTVVEQAPVINVEADLEESYYTGATIALPAATAVNGANKTFTVTCEVLRNGTSVYATTGDYTLASAGDYEVVYTVTMADGRAIEKSYAFTVEDDNQLPEIVVNGAYAASYESGTVISLLKAVVFDNDEATVSVTVYCDGQRVDVEDTEFALTGKQYKVVYSATDASGNEAADVVFEFTVKDAENGADGGNEGCKSSITSLGLSVGIALMSIALLRFKKKSNEEE